MELLPSGELLSQVYALGVVEAGNPVIFADYTASTDFVTGAKSEARPEATQATLGLTQMAHHLGLPIFTISGTTAVESDAQMGWENMSTFLSLYLGGVDAIGTLGDLATDEVFDPRALVMADEMAGWIKHFAKGITVDEESIALDLQIERGTAPLGGSYLSSRHTLSHYHDACWQPSAVTNGLARDAWVEAGSVSIYERAANRARELLASHKSRIPESQAAALRDFVAEILEREGVTGDEAKQFIAQTYWDPARV